ncbi:phenylalanine--tRNA ligase subunit beta [Prochlorococcus sp. MIT 1341]|uniref:phenylalanine--tRNA ligase subunit beta n=1 Tax=Prochlorococcus sp. MIT 1341 TaxID=3096221 RepID=UPI002A75775D|nr:phenylalanine--tRNA ligase subunit beta [Prochlorococcus sp. MIT 1341]
MRVPLSWIREYVSIQDYSANHIAEKLSMAGFEVEAVDDSSQNAKGVVVGRIQSVDSHPNAEKLNVCKVEIGKNEPIQIVCGASNVKPGIHVPVALEGAELKNIGMKIKESEIRGVKSYGMICSLKELGLENESEGIAILDEITDEVRALGTKVDTLLGLNDQVLDIAITANRPDGMSIIGIAREISAILSKKPLKEEEHLEVTEIQQWDPNSKQEELGNTNLYSLTFIDDINNKLKTPNIIRERLDKCKINTVNPLVDITNYVMLKDGQPLHVFDIDALEKLTDKKVDQDSFCITYAKESELFEGLDNNKITLNNDVLMITCNGVNVAIAGVMGSRHSGVTDMTKRVVLEAAVFPQSLIRIGARSIGIRTESSSRFEKGVAEDLTLDSALGAVSMIKKVCEANPKQTWFYSDSKIKKRKLILRREAIERILGPIIDKKEAKELIYTERQKESNQRNSNVEYITDENIEEILYSLNLDFIGIKQGWQVEIPAYRVKDITREIDIIEEIARMVGYDNFSYNLPEPIKPGVLNDEQIFERTIRNSLTSVGIQEITTMSLVGREKNNPTQVIVKNPFLSEASCLRTNLWEEHIEICKRNLKASKLGCWIFEIGKIYQLGRQNEINEKTILSGIICGEKGMEFWTDESKKIKNNYYRARGLIELVFRSMKLELVDKPIKDERLHPGRASEQILEGKHLGYFGQIHPAICEKNDLPYNTFLFEFNYNQLSVAATRSNKLRPTLKSFATVPHVERDISLVVDKNVLASDIISVIKKSARPLLETVELIDRYEDKNIEQLKCSQAFRLRYRSKERTLTDEIIEPIHEKVRIALVKQLNAELRS